MVIHVPILVCACFNVDYLGEKISEMRNYQGVNCIQEFLEDVLNLEKNLKEIGKKYISEAKDEEESKERKS